MKSAKEPNLQKLQNFLRPWKISMMISKKEIFKATLNYPKLKNVQMIKGL